MTKPDFLRNKTKRNLLIGLVLMVGSSIGFNLYNARKGGTFNFSQHGTGDGTSELYKPPINAADEAGRLIQRASENYFFHEFVQGAENYRKAIAIYETRKNFTRAAKTYESLGDLYRFANQVEEAETSYLKAVDYHTSNHDAVGTGRALKHVGDLQLALGHEDSAGEWYEKAGQAIEGAQPHRDKAKVYESIGQYYWKIENIPQAIGHFTHAQETFAALKDQMGYDHVTKVLGILKKKKNLPHPPRGRE
ncbi:MAG: tetratricopeptide repeat protein [Nitrospinaceae bacterium]